MFHSKPALWLAFVSTTTCAAALEQQPAMPSASAASAPTPYRSAFESYQPFAEQKLVPWKEANDTVGKIGGWRSYAREANEAAGKSAPPSAPAAPASSSGHKH